MQNSFLDDIEGQAKQLPRKCSSNWGYLRSKNASGFLRKPQNYAEPHKLVRAAHYRLIIN
jgi:hypothetical protein